jgi:ParB-like chromosome segregation protein Spo0J
VIRIASDTQMLTIGAQENLQRQDLDPLEEAQIVAWHEQVFFDKNQAELGAMLGKSSDWVSVRSRIYKLPEVLKERLRDRPRAIAQMLELGSLYAQQPEVALTLADRVVQENLTLDAIRGLVRGYARPEARDASRTGAAERRGAATEVQEITNSPSSDQDRHSRSRPTATISHKPDMSDLPRRIGHPPVEGGAFPSAVQMPMITDELWLQQAAETLSLLASRANELAVNDVSRQLLDQMEAALSILRRAFTESTSGENSQGI